MEEGKGKREKGKGEGSLGREKANRAAVPHF